MSVVLNSDSPTLVANELQGAVDAACARIAPAWPLDRMIAVNPYWGFVGLPIETAAAELGALSGASFLMPRSWYRTQWTDGQFATRHLNTAWQLTHARRITTRELLAPLSRDEPTATQRALMSDVADVERDQYHEMTWSEFIVRHVSQACAAYFDEGQASWGPRRDAGLWQCWRALARRDHSPRLLMGARGFRSEVAALPDEPLILIDEAVRALNIAPTEQSNYFTALLLSVNGWASACAFRRWEARLAQSDDDGIVHLLAIRLAWELIVLRLGDEVVLKRAWTKAQRWWPLATQSVAAAQREDWVLQRAFELAYQETMTRKLLTTNFAERVVLPSVQVVFCIDVRSEVFRRALESVAPSVQTLGFAGFFGLPIAYKPVAGPARAQLPGLLAPSLLVQDVDAVRHRPIDAELLTGDWFAVVKGLGSFAGSAFSYVESVGLGWAGALVRDGFSLGARAGDVLREDVREREGVVPELQRHVASGESIDLPSRVRLAAGVLRAMGLTKELAPIVAIIGHGASTENNPQAAGLHCGACGGQTGEVNARALAALLSDDELRAGLRAEGIDVSGTTFVAGLHDTTTDDVTLYDAGVGSAADLDRIARFRAQLAAAGSAARRERSATLGLTCTPDAKVDAAIRARAQDWSEVRPEWGLAGNASFIIAPRERTRGVDLGGRSFLHDYRWPDDPEFRVLELIMTAPMVVTHWINMQYYASAVDPLRYGSGNKTLHNVVGGRLGVMEGAGGDLRIGLAWQSVHDGIGLRHQPLRLSVFIAAPAEAIDDIIARHPVVRDLVLNAWLFVHRIDRAECAVYRRVADGWERVAEEMEAV